jgi:hypothetical protein
VLEAIPGPYFRRSLRFVLVLLGLLALADRVDASGCHVAERPSFGIIEGPIGLDRAPGPHLTTPSDPIHYRQAPCPGESAGLPSKIQVPRASVSTPPLLDRPIEVEPRAIEPADPRLPLAESRPLERPPRDLPVPPLR